ncbi:hypothetical protein SAFG77S_12696 [Streptomyces afghaniensis]
MLLARQVLLHGDLGHHRHDHRPGRDVRAVVPSQVDGESHHRRRRPGVDDLSVRGGQSQRGVRAQPDAQAGVQRARERRQVRDEQRPPPAQAELRDAEHQQELCQRAPHRQVQGGHEQRQRSTQECEPQRVLGPNRPDVLHEPVAPGLVVHHVQRGREAHGRDRRRHGPQAPLPQRPAHGRVQGPPFGAGPAGERGHRVVLVRMSVRRRVCAVSVAQSNRHHTRRPTGRGRS